MKNLCLVIAILSVFFTVFADDDDYDYDDEKLKLAIMEFEDKSSKVSENTLEAATEYLRSVFTSTGNFIVISKGKQKEQLSKIRKEFNTNPTYQSCNDRSCQIQLGQALSADLILQTTITIFAGVYTISSDLTDLEKEATEIGGKADYDGSEISMKKAIESIVEQINTNHQHLKNEKAAKIEAEKQRKKKERKAEKAGEMAENKLKETRTLKISGIALIAGGTGILAGGVTGFAIASDKEQNEYDQMSQSSKIKEAVNKGEDLDSYLARANKHKDKSKTYRNIAITSAVIGAAIAGTGIALVVVGVKKEKNNEQIILDNISAMPLDNGFYASLNFKF